MAFPKWLQDEMQMSAEEAALHGATFDVIFTPERLTRLEQGYLNAKQLADARTAHEAKVQADMAAVTTAQQELDQQILSYAQQENLTKAQRQQLERDYQTTSTRVAALQAALRTTALNAGMDPEATINAALAAAGGQPATPATTPTQPGGTVPAPFDPNQFLPRDAGNRLGNLALMAPAVLNQLQREYHELTGTNFDDVKVVQEVLKRAGDPRNQKSIELRDVYSEMFDVEAKKVAAEQKRVADLVAAAEARGRQAGLSEAALPGSGQSTQPDGRPVGRHSPVLQPHTSVLQRPNAPNHLSGAVAAFQTGKYRQERPGAPAAAAS